MFTTWQLFQSRETEAHICSFQTRRWNILISPPPWFPLNLCVSGRNNNVPTEGTPVIQTIKTYCGSKNDPLTERKLPCEWDSSPSSAVAVFLSPASLSCFSVSDNHARLFMIQLFVPQPTGNICTMSHSRSEWKDLKHSENKSECWRRRRRQGQLAAGKKGGTDETEKRRKQDGERRLTASDVSPRIRTHFNTLLSTETWK